MLVIEATGSHLFCASDHTQSWMHLAVAQRLTQAVCFCQTVRQIVDQMAGPTWDHGMGVNITHP